MKLRFRAAICCLFLVWASCKRASVNAPQSERAIDNNYVFIVSSSDLYNLLITNKADGNEVLKIPNLDCKPEKFYKKGERYIYTCSDDENNKTVWEIEFSLKRVMQLDLKETDLNEYERIVSLGIN